MKKTSEKYLKKGIKLYDLLYQECADRLSDFYDIKESLEYLNRDLRELENETIGTVNSNEFSKKIKILSEQLEMLEGFRFNSKINLANFKQELEKGNLSSDNLSIEELKDFQSRTNYFIELFSTVLDSIKSIREDVDEIKKLSSQGISSNGQVESLYQHSEECKMKIEQVAFLISENVKSGKLHDIVMADSLLKSDIELLKKEQNKR